MSESIMNESKVNLALLEQYGAAIEMMKKAVDNCPKKIWIDRSLGTPFWQVVNHALYYLDWYLSITKEEREFFQPEFPEIPQGPSATQNDPISKSEILDYLVKIKQKAKKNLHSLSIEDIQKPSIFEWHGSSILSSLMYNIRHLMLHIGTLNLRLYHAGISFESWESQKQL